MGFITAGRAVHGLTSFFRHKSDRNWTETRQKSGKNQIEKALTDIIRYKLNGLVSK